MLLIVRQTIDFFALIAFERIFTENIKLTGLQRLHGFFSLVAFYRAESFSSFRLGVSCLAFFAHHVGADFAGEIISSFGSVYDLATDFTGEKVLKLFFIQFKLTLALTVSIKDISFPSLNLFFYLQVLFVLFKRSHAYKILIRKFLLHTVKKLAHNIKFAFI